MTNIVEKPGKENAPSDLASVSSYLLPGEIFRLSRQSQGRIWRQRRVYNSANYAANDWRWDLIFTGVEITNGTYYDTGDKLEYLKTVIDFGLRDPNFGDKLRAHLADRLNNV